MWVANAGSDNVTELSPAGKVLGTFPAGDNPAAIAFDGTNLWIPDGASDDVVELPVS
jgi:DNA-binding beta-propeller fold protein YncE